MARAHTQPVQETDMLNGDTLWYKDAIIYELHVRAFYDSNGDGVGDFRGLTQRLDYLQDLGVTAIWLLPFYPSPLRDDGYDIADYGNVHESYGTIRDFKVFLREAHRRGLRVITELVINHTSDQHPWFQRSRRAKPGSRWRNFYVWSDTPERYQEARIIFKDFEPSNWTWDSVAQAYYWHRFYSHQPDLNFENPEVIKAILRIMDFWMKMGVDGLRLDAIPYLFERDGTNCENLPETHGALKALRKHLDKHHKGRMFLAEANQWPEDAAAYFGDGDECHMSFHFPLMPRLFMAVRMEDRYPIVDILEQTPAIPESCQWAVFLRNHDELTLEMVTDEERDYMYRSYAHDSQMRINLGIRRRLAPLLENDRRRIELLTSLLLAMPGTPVLYYGDEIGMGDNFYLGDRNGVRTPMQWSPDRNAGFSRANPQKLYFPVIIDPEYHFEALNVESQHNNPHSLFWWTKRLIGQRKRFQAFGRGTVEFLHPDNRAVLAFLRKYEDEHVLVVANLSRFTQYVELDLSEYKGLAPVELFGGTTFPMIGELPYLLTLSPYAFNWFNLKAGVVATGDTPQSSTLPTLTVADRWESLFQGRGTKSLEAILPRWLQHRRWFGGKARRPASARIVECIDVKRQRDRARVFLTLVEVAYPEGESETYVLPLTHASEEATRSIFGDSPHAAVARVEIRGRDEYGILFDAFWDASFGADLLDAFVRRRRFRGAKGELRATPARAFRRLHTAEPGEPPEPSLSRAEQSNTSVVFGDRFLLKVFRRPEAGPNPDLEIGAFLTEKASFAHSPVVAGALEYRGGRDGTVALGILQEFVPNGGDAWTYTLGSLSQYFERVLTQSTDAESEVTFESEGVSTSVIQRALQPPPEEDSDASAVDKLIGAYSESARLLGRRTAELHMALASGADEPDFAPEPFGALYQRSIYQSMRNLTSRNFQLLRKQRNTLPETVQAAAADLAGRQADVLERFQALTRRKLSATRIRCHGDYHLGQVLYTGQDFVIIDFEGEPARSLTERRRKRSPLTDVAGMLRSFDYAAHTALAKQVEIGMIQPDEVPAKGVWAERWYQWVASTFLRSYLEAADSAAFLPRDPAELELMLHAYILEKAVYELGYELNNRPTWVHIPVQGILGLLEADA